MVQRELDKKKKKKKVDHSQKLLTHEVSWVKKKFVNPKELKVYDFASF